MTKVVVETVISAPIEACFDLARSISTHIATTSKTQETIVSNHENDLLELGDIITFEANHLGTRRSLTARIVEFNRPHGFADEMLRGDFRRLRHIHRFEERSAKLTAMTDVLEFESAYGWVDPLILRPYLRRFLTYRAKGLKDVAEQLTHNIQLR